MSNKSSLDYTELAGLQIFLSNYLSDYEKRYGKFDNTYNSTVDPQAIIVAVLNRIKELQDK